MHAQIANRSLFSAGLLGMRRWSRTVSTADGYCNWNGEEKIMQPWLVKAWQCRIRKMRNGERGALGSLKISLCGLAHGYIFHGLQVWKINSCLRLWSASCVSVDMTFASFLPKSTIRLSFGLPFWWRCLIIIGYFCVGKQNKSACINLVNS